MKTKKNTNFEPKFNRKLTKSERKEFDRLVKNRVNVNEQDYGTDEEDQKFIDYLTKSQNN